MIVLAFLSTGVLSWPLGSLVGRSLSVRRVDVFEVHALRKAGRVAIEIHEDVDHPGSALACGVRQGGVGLFMSGKLLAA